tara:strand:- start:1704 stop:2729 length:1026 start_codon:yes stop_codon:yes gene_type:complete
MDGVNRTAYRGNVAEQILNTVLIKTDSGMGAGVVLDKQTAYAEFSFFGKELLDQFTLIVTNFHVVESGESPHVFFASQDELSLDKSSVASAEVIATVPLKDLALLSINKKPNHVAGVSIRRTSSSNIGDDVSAVGHPIGEAWTYTKGYISQVRKNYSWRYNDATELTANVIQTQTPISGGNSGGPLFNKAGNLIGINTMGSSSGQNINYAVAATEISLLSEAATSGFKVFQEKNKWDWDFAQSYLADSFRMIQSGQEDGVAYQVYDARSDSNFQLLLLFADKQSAPVFYYENEIKGETYEFLFDPDHSNKGAWYKATIKQKGEVIAEGWDFDGDFQIDYFN